MINLNKSYTISNTNIIEKKQTIIDKYYSNNNIPDGKKAPYCKYCFCDETDKLDPLIHICKCSGSVALAHLECIKKWLSLKLLRKENKTITLVAYNNIHCEICNAEIPEKFIFKFFLHGW